MVALNSFPSSEKQVYSNRIIMRKRIMGDQHPLFSVQKWVAVIIAPPFSVQQLLHTCILSAKTSMQMGGHHHHPFSLEAIVNCHWEVIGDLLNNNMILLTLALDPHGRWGPLMHTSFSTRLLHQNINSKTMYQTHQSWHSKQQPLPAPLVYCTRRTPFGNRIV
jgi:hypothetical protein